MEKRTDMTSAEKADMSSANNTAGVCKQAYEEHTQGACASGVKPDHAAAGVNADGAATGSSPDGAATGMNPDDTATGINPDDAVIGTTAAVCTTRHFHCTTCPSECALTIETCIDENRVEHVLSVQGNRCARGRKFAEQEVIRPMRILATTIVVRGGDEKLLPVRTARPIPRDLHLRAMRDIRHASVTAPVHMGDVVMSDLLGTGVDLIASMNVDAQKLASC